MQVVNFGAKHGSEWAPSRRNLGRLFVCTKHKSYDLAEWSGAPNGSRSTTRVRRIKRFDHGLTASLFICGSFCTSRRTLAMVGRDHGDGSREYCNSPGRMTRGLPSLSSQIGDRGHFRPGGSMESVI